MKYFTTMFLACSLLAFAGTASASEKDGKGEGKSAHHRHGNVMERFDKNKDGVLTRDEVNNDKAWARISKADANNDGKVTAEELKAAHEARKAAKAAKK